MCTGSWPGTITVLRSLARLSCLATFSTATKLATCDRRRQAFAQVVPSHDNVSIYYQDLHVERICRCGIEHIDEASKKDLKVHGCRAEVRAEPWGTLHAHALAIWRPACQEMLTWPSGTVPSDIFTAARMRCRRVMRLPDSMARGTESAYVDTLADRRGSDDASTSSMASHHASSHLLSASLELPASIILHLSKTRDPHRKSSATYQADSSPQLYL